MTSPRLLAWLSGAAFVFSLAHLIGAVVAIQETTRESLLRGLPAIVLIAVIYTWWSDVIGKSVRGDRAALSPLLAFSFGWAFLGSGVLALIACPWPCTNHATQQLPGIGNVVLGGAASYLTVAAIRRRGATLAWKTPVATMAIAAGILARFLAEV